MKGFEKVVHAAMDITEHAGVAWLLHLPRAFTYPLLAIASLCALAGTPVVRRRVKSWIRARRRATEAMVTVIERNGRVTTFTLRPGEKVVLQL